MPVHVPDQGLCERSLFRSTNKRYNGFLPVIPHTHLLEHMAAGFLAQARIFSSTCQPGFVAVLVAMLERVITEKPHCMRVHLLHLQWRDDKELSMRIIGIPLDTCLLGRRKFLALVSSLCFCQCLWQIVTRDSSCILNYTDWKPSAK